MANARSRQRRQGRRTPFRDAKPRILIVSEGENTEPQYFRGFAKACHNPRVTIEIAREHGVPKTCVEVAKEYKQDADDRAKREKDDNLAYERVWCVFDVDDHARIGEAREMARDNNIELAISNPCIEIWLLLHFTDNPGMQHRNEMKRLLKVHVPAYDKHVNYATYSAGYSEAVMRARRMDQAADDAHDSGRNPTTGVWRLTEAIRSDDGSV